MRNIKTTLRFVRNSALLFVAASGMSYLTACSETDINPDNGGNNDDDNLLVEQLKVTTGTNPNLAVTYDNSRQGTRASFVVPEHPGMPKVEDLPTTYDYTLDESFANNAYLTIIYPDDTPEITDMSTVDSRIETKYWDEEKTNPYYELHGVNVKVPKGTYNLLPGKFTVYYQCQSPYWRKQVTVDNVSYFIDDEVNTGQTSNNDKIDFYILNGGKFSDNSSIQSNTTIYLYEGGKILRASTEENKIYLMGKLISEAAIGDDKTSVYVQGDCYTYGKIHGKYVELNNSGDIYAGCAITAVEKVYITNSAKICAGYISAPTVTLDSNAHILLRDGGFMYAPTKLEVSNVESVRVEAEEGEYAMVQTATLALNNTSLWNSEKGAQDAINAFRNIGIKFNASQYTNGETINADEILFHESVNANGKGEITYYLNSGDECAPYKVSDTPEEKPGNTGNGDDNTGNNDDNTGNNDDNTGNNDDNSGNNPDDNSGNNPDDNPGNNPGDNPGISGEEPAIPGTDPEPTPGPRLENIGSVAPSDGDAHTHPISATCIFTNGQDAYLSWHTQGANFHGCIEYLTVANGTVTLNSYLETAPTNDIYGAVDFNHVIFDNGKIFVAGDHPKKGGILGWIECNDGKFTTGEAVLNMRTLYNEKGGSGNCIIRNGNYYQVASVKGFETYNVADFVGAAKPKAVAQLAAYDFDPLGASAEGRQTGKHIAIGGGKVVMLTLINRDNTANTAKASIKVYDATDVKYENVVASYVVEDAVLSPVDGKDVIATNGEDIWVCLGKGGVQHLRLAGSNITKVSEFVLTNMTKEELKGWEMSSKEAAASCANGLAVDSNYVYVAHGGAGLIVLDKEDLSLVTRTRYNGGKSANYVNLGADGYIYVAYGQSNVQVFAWRND